MKSARFSSDRFRRVARNVVRPWAIGGIFAQICAWFPRLSFRMFLENRKLLAASSDFNDAVNALRLSEAWLDKSQRLANIGHWERDLESGEILWSDQVYRIFGVDPGSFKVDFEMFIERVHPEDREKIRVTVSHALARGGRYRATHRIIRPNGEIRVVEQNGEVIAGEGDKPGLFFGTAQDVTELQETQEALRQSETRFRAAFEAGGAGMIISDSNGNYLRVNQAFCDLVGYSAEELRGMRVRELTHPDDILNHDELFPKLFSGELSSITREKRFIRKDGSTVWAIINGAAMEKTPAGNTIIISNIQDITERKQAEEIAAIVQKRLVEAQRIGNIGDFERNLVTGEMFCSDQAYRILGVNPEETSLSYQEFLSRVHPEDRHVILDSDFERTEEGKRYGRDYRIIHPDGDIRHIHSEVEFFRDAGKVSRIAGTVQDVTDLHRTQLALVDSEARFRGVFDAGAAGIFLSLPRGPLQQHNRAFADFIGYSDEELAKMSGIDLLHPDDRERAAQERRNLLDGKFDRLFSERRFIHKDGRIRWANVGVSRVQLPNLSEPCLIITTQDITERKRADAEVARQAGLLDLIREIALASNRTNDFAEVVELSLRRVCEFLDWPVGHAYDAPKGDKHFMKSMAIWYLPDADRFDPFRQATTIMPMDPGKFFSGEVLETASLVWREHIPRKLDNPSLRTLACMETGLCSGFAAPVMVGEEVVAVLEFFSDRQMDRDEAISNAVSQIGTELGRVYERQRAALALSRREEQLRQIIDNAPLHIFVRDHEGRFLLANEAVAAVYDMTPEELVGRKQEDVYPYPDRVAKMLQSDQEIIANGEPQVFEHISFYNYDGSKRDVRVFKVPFTTYSGEVAVLGISVDITDEKRAEAELWRAQRMDALGQMTGGVAHDFSNLLMIMQGNLQLLHRRIEDPDLRELADTAIRAARRGGDLTGRLLAFARSQPLLPRVVNLNALIEDILPLILQAVGQEIGADCTLSPDLWNAEVDRSELENALINLAVNARDAMPDGGRISFITHNEVIKAENGQGRTGDLPVGKYAVISVRDTGVGMTDEVAARALEPFFTTKEFGGGSGLGLSGVYGFVQQSGGDVVIDTAPGKGTTISIWLPWTAETLEAHKDGPGPDGRKLSDKPFFEDPRTVNIRKVLNLPARQDLP
jgi:PAS domain S-box-containing protein